ncbi:MAG: universal stress protein [Chitinophagales bacterium]|nr:universal stress protein [Chitinophagales bacterium]
MKTILVPTDFSDNAVNAMKYAIRLAEKLDSKMIFFHSTHIPLRVELFGIPYSDMRKLERQDVVNKTAILQNMLNKLYREMRYQPDSKKVRLVVKNEVLIVEDIIQAAQSSKAGLIVMGTHGASGINKLFGSTTSLLISKCEIPVLAIPPKYQYKEIKTMLYFSDLRNPATELSMLVPLAKAYGATIDIFNLSYNPEVDEEKLFKKLNGVAKGVKLELIQLKRNPGETVLQQLREFLDYRKPDWAVMFPEKKRFFEYIFEGSKTERLSYNLKVPLLSVKKR